MMILLRCEVLPKPHNGRVAELILQLVIVVAPASYVTILFPVIIRHVRFSFSQQTRCKYLWWGGPVKRT